MLKKDKSLVEFGYLEQTNKDRERNPKFKTKEQDFSNGKWIQKEGAKKGTLVFIKNDE